MRSSFLVVFLYLFPLVVLGQQKSSSVNLSLWSPVATNKYDSLSKTKLSFGLLQSKVHNLTGIGLNTIGSKVTGNIKGVNFSGGYSVVKGNLTGISVGSVNILEGKMKGLELGFLLNMNLNSTKGFQIASLSNMTIGKFRGFQLAAGYNIVSNEASGVQFAGIANIAARGSKALQAAAFFNIGLESMKGFQVSAANFANIIQGVQLGLLNVSTEVVKGAQIGIVNYSNKKTSMQLGLVNITATSKFALMMYGGNFLSTNIAIRIQNKRTYSILGLGFPYDIGGDFSGGVFYRYGIWFPIKRFSVRADAGLYFLSIFDDDAFKDKPMNEYSLQGRLSLEYAVGERTSVFLAGGWSYTSEYGENSYRDKPILELGVNLRLTNFSKHK